MPGDSTHDARIFILNFALNQTVSKTFVVRSRNRPVPPRCRRFESGMRHAEWAEYFSLAKLIKGFIGQTLKGNSQHDEADIAVYRLRSGVGGQRSRERLP